MLSERLAGNKSVRNNKVKTRYMLINKPRSGNGGWKFEQTFSAKSKDNNECHAYPKLQCLGLRKRIIQGTLI